MKKTIIKALILFVSIPLINAIVFAVGTLFHEMEASLMTKEQFDSYESAISIMIYASGLAVFVIEGMHDQRIVKNSMANLLYIAVFAYVAFSTSDQFLLRPYEHGLTFLSMVSVLATRIYLNKKLNLRQDAF